MKHSRGGDSHESIRVQPGALLRNRHGAGCGLGAYRSRKITKEQLAKTVETYDKHRKAVQAEIEALYPGHAGWLVTDFVEQEAKRRAKLELRAWKQN
jgi:hypothetical protein